MAATKKQVSSYNTHLIGVVKSVLDSTRILVYSKTSFKSKYPDIYEKISIYNLTEVYEKVKGLSDISVTIDRSGTKKPYKFLASSFSDNCGFNVIIYIDSVGNPLGYTEFSLAQGTNQDVFITIDFKSSITLSGLTVTIENSLQALRGKTNDRTLGGELWDYTSAKSAAEHISSLGCRPYYSSDLRAVVQGDKKAVDYLPGVGIVDSGGVLKTLYLSKDLTVNPGRYPGFVNGNIGLYGNNIAVYLWDKSGNFLIYGISKGAVNVFGKPTSYVNLGTKGYSTVKPQTSRGYQFVKIKYGAGKYLVCEVYDSSKKQTREGVYDTFREDWVDAEFAEGVIINPFDPTAKIYTKIPQRQSSDLFSLRELFPFLANLSYDVTQKPPLGKDRDAYGYDILRVTGNWVLMKRTYGEETAWIASSPNLTVFMTEEESERLVYVNDSTLMIDALPEGTAQNYYTLYQGTEGTVWETEHYISLKNPGQSMVADGIWLASYDRLWLYESGKIKTAKQYVPVSENSLNWYRRDILPRSSSGVISKCTPKLVWADSTVDNCYPLVGAFGGILFYLDETKTKISYL